MQLHKFLHDLKKICPIFSSKAVDAAPYSYFNGVFEGIVIIVDSNEAFVTSGECNLILLVVPPVVYVRAWQS